MKRLRGIAAFIGVIGAFGLQATPPAASADSIGDLCDLASPSAAACIGFQKLTDAAAATCRTLGLPDSACALPLSHRVLKGARDAYLKSWVHRAVAFQYRLGNPLPLTAAQWIGTHNSFNTVANGVTLSHIDSNQQLTIPELLSIDVRGIELDPHWLPRLNSAGGDVIVCHGRGADEQNLGCTTEPPLTHVLGQVAGWLNDPANRRQVIMLYLDNSFGPAAAYAKTISDLDTVLRRPDGSSLIYHPDPSAFGLRGCQDVPLSISRDDIRAAGAQVIIVGNCESGWAPDVFAWDQTHVESGNTGAYQPFPACDATYPRPTYESKIVRYYEDSTFLSAVLDPTETPQAYLAQSLTPARVSSMTRCGVQLLGMDQLLPADGRLEASVWSWAPNEPKSARGPCTLQRRDGRWRSGRCHPKRRSACLDSSGTWKLSAPVRFGEAKSACEAKGARFALPRTGYENALLHQTAGSRQAVWIRYRRG